MNGQTPTDYSSSGALVISVFSAGGAIPINDALVTVRSSDKESSGVLAVMVTDNSGKTQKIMLPTPPASESESPGINKPYATYNVDVDKAGFFPASFINVPVFAGTTSIQPVNLIPLTEYSGDSLAPDSSIITEGQNPNL